MKLNTKEEVLDWLTARAVAARLQGKTHIRVGVHTGIRFYATFAVWRFAPESITKRGRAGKWRPIPLDELAWRLRSKEIRTDSRALDGSMADEMMHGTGGKA